MIRMLPVCLILVALGVFCEQGPSKSPPKTETGKGVESPPKKIPVDKMKFPSGSLFYLVEEFKDEGIFMTWKKLQEMTDKIAALENQLEGDKGPPHSCKLTGTLKGNFVQFMAEYEFETKENARVSLGLLGGQLKGGELDDGQLPHLEFGEDGFTIKVEKKGRHTLRLDFDVPVGLRRSGAVGGGSERNFDLGLPGAAVNLLNLDLPSAVKELRLNEKLEKRPQAGHWMLQPDLKDKKIIVAWKDPVTAPGTGPELWADGQITVSLEENLTQITADLTLKDRRGVAKEWQLWLPPQALQGTVKVDPTIGEIITPLKGNLPHKVKLKEETSEPFHVLVSYRLPRLAKIPVGPLTVENAGRQEGTITIKATAEALRGVRLEYIRHGEINQTEPPKKADAVAEFKYWSMPKNPKGIPLEIDSKKEKAQLVVEHDHHLRLVEGNQVEATTRIKIKALTGPVDNVKVQLPALPAEAAMVLIDSTAPFYPGFLTLPAYPWAGDLLRQARIQSHSAKTKEIIVKGTYLLPAKAQKARLELPRLLASPDLGLVDNGAKVTVEVGENQEILLDAEVPAPDRHKHTTDWPQAPTVVDFAWRTYRPAFAVTGIADVELHEDHAHVRQQLQFPEPGKAGHGKAIEAHLPAGLRGLKVIRGKASEGKGGAILLETDGKEPVVILEYDFLLPPRENQGKAGTRVFAVPLVWPAQATRIEAKVRFFCEPGAVPALADSKQNLWFNRGLEVVAGKDSLPALVLQASGVTLPLSIQLQAPAAAKQVDVVIDRAIIQAQVDGEGQLYRARFLVRKFHTQHVELEFPMPVSNIGPVVYLDDKEVPHEKIGNILRLTVIPNTKPVRLDVEYRLPAELLDQEPFWQTELHPPVFRGQVFMPRVGWQVNLPAPWTPVVAGENTVLDYHWAFHSGMLKPDPSAGAEFDTWPGKLWDQPGSPSVVFWRPSLGPVRVAHVPWQMWFFLCSGVVLFVGLVITFMSLSRFVFWLLMGILILGVLAARFLWPSLVPVMLYGCQPGVLVLAVMVGVQWLVRERYRRQLVFLPGFKRVKGGSSMIRGSASRSTVPSTVDAPPPSSVSMPGSSVNKIV